MCISCFIYIACPFCARKLAAVTKIGFPARLRGTTAGFVLQHSGRTQPATHVVLITFLPHHRATYPLLAVCVALLIAGAIAEISGDDHGSIAKHRCALHFKSIVVRPSTATARLLQRLWSRRASHCPTSLSVLKGIFVAAQDDECVDTGACGCDSFLLSSYLVVSVSRGDLRYSFTLPTSFDSL